MQYLDVMEGWAPLAYYAPASALLRKEAQEELQGRVDLPPAATRSDWEIITQKSLEALHQGHEAQLTLPESMGLADVPETCTVHADARLINTMARRSPNGTGWEISFVDFGWSGICKLSRWEAMT